MAVDCYKYRIILGIMCGSPQVLAVDTGRLVATDVNKAYVHCMKNVINIATRGHARTRAATSAGSAATMSSGVWNTSA